MEALSGLLVESHIGFGVEVGRYLECGRLGRNVYRRRHLLDDAILRSGLFLQFTRRL
jgi:hypothetical protein